MTVQKPNLRKTKLCKLCQSPRYGLMTLCFKHYKAKVRLQRQERLIRKQARKIKTKKYLKSEQKQWHRKCWILMSERVRSKYADWKGMVKCYTCPKVLHWKEMHAGHFKHGTLDFDSRNLRPQCAECNTYKGGRLDVYAINLVRENGIEWVEQLEKDAAQHQGYKVEELKEIYVRLQSL